MSKTPESKLLKKRENYQENRLEILAKQKEWKEKKKAENPVEFFARRRAYWKRWHLAHPGHKTQQTSPEKKTAWAQRNKEHIRAQRAARYQELKDELRERLRQRKADDPSILERQRAYARRWRAAHPKHRTTKWAGDSPEYRREASKRSYWKHREARLERTRRRRSIKPDKKPAKGTSYKWHLKRKYGLSFDAYIALFESQGGRCALCLLPLPGTGGGHGTVVDHDHVRGNVRGLLHGKCNLVIGVAGDSQELLLKAVEYLRKHNG